MVMPWPTARDQNEVFHWDCESTSLAGCPAVADPGLLSGAGARALLKVLYLGLWLRLNITWGRSYLCLRPAPPCLAGLQGREQRLETPQWQVSHVTFRRHFRLSVSWL